MAGLQSVAAIFLIFSIFSSATSLHLANLRTLPDALEARSNGNGSSSTDSADNTGASVKGNIGSISSIISNPTQIINQIQSTVNTFLQTLNNTLSGSSSNVTSLLGSLKNITNKPSGSFRLEDTDQLVANISEIVKNTKRAEAESLNNSTTQFESQVHGAFEDFRKTILELQRSVHEHISNDDPSSAVMDSKSGSENESTTSGSASTSPSSTAGVEASNNSSKVSSRRIGKAKGLPRTLFDQISSLREQLDLSIERSMSNARSTIEDSLQLARQNSQIMRNQTSTFMGEMTKIFNEFSAPFRNFFETLRRGRPTAVVTA